MAPPKQRYPEVDQISHIRYSPAGDIALVSPARGKKPASSIDQACIFCPESRDKLAESFLKGNSLDEMLERGLYILDNAFPVVSVPDSAGGNDAGRASPAGFSPVFYDMSIAHGRHLVMIETDNHHLNPFSDGAETKGYYQNLVWGYIQMLKSLEAEGYVWGGVGKNRNGLTAEGRVIDAGASQRHPHSQAIAMNGLVPRGLEAYVLSTKEIDNHLITDGSGKLLLRGCSGCLEVRDNLGSSHALYANDAHTSFVAPVPKGQNPYHVEIRIIRAILKTCLRKKQILLLTYCTGPWCCSAFSSPTWAIILSLGRARGNPGAAEMRGPPTGNSASILHGQRSIPRSTLGLSPTF